MTHSTTRGICRFAAVLAAALSLFSALPPAWAADPEPPRRLWPETAPGETVKLAPEHDSTKPEGGRVAGRTVVRWANVSEPTLQVFRPPAGRANGTAVLICPGGAYHILAMDLEGTEVCEWLNSMGVTGVLLKYRVPRREGLEKHVAPLQDAQRAMGLMRKHAGDWGLNPQRLGVLGFSAGGHLAATLSTTPGRIYPRADDADELSCRPNFTVLVYPAYLTVKEENDRIAPELKIDSETPPTFMVMTGDDPVRAENVLHYGLALKTAGVPMELHLFPKGGHGYGLRLTDLPVTRWPILAAAWMEANGWLARD